MDKQIQIITKDMNLQGQKPPASSFTHEIVHKIKRDVLLMIVLKLKYSEIEIAKAKLLAREVIDICESENTTDIFRGLFELSKRYKGVDDIFIKQAKSYDKLFVKEGLIKIVNELRKPSYAKATEGKGGEN